MRSCKWNSSNSKLKPSAEANKQTLIRRVSLDLVGLLPTPEEVTNFVNDSSPNAYEKLVDRLLASPHYGERQARHWLEMARYADSNGYTIDGARSIWPYRDWVIQALNKDMPFDQFTIEQLAGDLLPKATKDQLVATGFHRNTGFNEEGGTDPEQFRVVRTIDRTNTTSAVWLGLTLGCAQCHDHKYDPLSQKDYYRLYAFFNSIDEPSITVGGTPELEKKINEMMAKANEGQNDWRSGDGQEGRSGNQEAARQNPDDVGHTRTQDTHGKPTSRFAATSSAKAMWCNRTSPPPSALFRPQRRPRTN